MPIKQEFIVLCGQAICNGGACAIEYHSDHRRFDDLSDAITHGFTLGRSDDFNIGILEGPRLVSLGWMDKKIVERDPTRLAEIAKMVGLQ